MKHFLVQGFSTIIIFCAVLLLPAQRAAAFALMGPYESWMSATNGFYQPGDIGGPMAITNGYRWNVPVITYAYDPSFVAYFGTSGIAAVDGAIAILNNLTNASQLNISDYPPDTTQVNYLADSQNLADLKSEALYYLLQQMGLAQPARSAFCLHDFSATDTNVFNVIDRNYDPITLAPSQAVNGAIYFDYFEAYGAYAYTMAEPIDPLADWFTAVADGDNSSIPQQGSFYTGLTKDDVAGLQYLLNPNNFNFETLLPDVQAAGSNPSQFVNLALRAGVGKVSFVRPAYDGLAGGFFVPYTYQYVDTYLSNGISMTQQLVRTVAKPDIIFSAADFSRTYSAAVCTGATNWINNAAINGTVNGAGPGIIRPPIHIAFQKAVESLAETSDMQTGGYAMIGQIMWGSFDGTANLPVSYPQGGLFETINQLNVTLFLSNTNHVSPPNFNGYSWQLPVPIGGSVTLQQSVNLKSWNSLLVVTNLGAPLQWQHIYANSKGFFRVVTNAP